MSICSQLAGCVVLALWCAIVTAQQYPTKPVRFVVASGPGGSTDGLARIIGERLGAAWNQGIVYDNRPGAGGIIAGEVTTHATPDGYTLLFSTSAPIAVSVSLYKKLPYDPVKDFAPIVLVATQPYMLIAHPSSASSVKELIAMAKAKPGQIAFSHTGAGTGTHLAGELFMRAAQVKLLSVPYKSIAGSITAVVSGEVPLTFTSVFSAWSQAKVGRARALAVTGKNRAPAATPRNIVVLLNQHVNDILARGEVKGIMTNLGYESAGGSPEEFAKFIKSEIANYAAVIKSAGIHTD